MKTVERGQQYRNLVHELMESPEVTKLHDCIKEILSTLGYDDSKLVFYLRSKFIKLDLKPTTVDVLIKNKVVGTIAVEEFKMEHRRTFICRVEDVVTD